MALLRWVSKEGRELEFPYIGFYSLSTGVGGEPADGGFQIFYTGIFIRKHKGVFIERIRHTEIDKKEKMKKGFAKQGAIERIPMGSHWE